MPVRCPFVPKPLRPPPLRLYSSTTSPSPKQQIIFSGIQPTGIPHLGNYLGALKNWVSLQSTLPSTSQILYSIVDLHAITVPYDPITLRSDREEMWCVLYAVGIDMHRCTVFEQSSVSPPHSPGKTRPLSLMCVGAGCDKNCELID